jgi:hypothetical protein
MKKSVLALFVVAVLLFSGCGPIPTTDPSNTGNPSKPGYPAAEVVVLENDYIKASYKGVTDMPSLGVFYLNLKIENKADKEIWVTLESADVDSETIPLITTGVPVYIRPGNSGVGAFIFSMVNLSIDSVKDAEKASFKIVVWDKESLDTMFTSEIVTVELN